MGEVRDREDGGGEDPEREPGDLDEPDDDLDDDLDAGDRGDRGDGDLLDEEDRRLPPIDREVLGEILVFVAKGLVDNPDAVSVQSVDREGGVTLRLTVDQPDMGKVIGRSGRTARALRTLLRAAGVRAGLSTFVEIVEGPEGSPGGSGG